MRTTKGPWRVVGKRDKDYAGAVVVDHSKGNIVADCNVLGFGKYSRTEKECEANARLIAAAPELLEAAKRLAKCEDDCQAIAFPSREDCAFARAAITKAIK